MARMFLKFVFEGKPMSKDNFKMFNRFTGRPFIASEFKHYERHIQWQFRNQAGGIKPLEGSLKVFLDAYLAKGQRLDTGNISKSVLDALNGFAWKDDSQIDEMVVRRFKRSDRPRIELKICGLGSPFPGSAMK